MRWQFVLVLPVAWLFGCQDSGKVPFHSSGGASFGGTGNKSGSGGNSGSGGSGGSSSCSSDYDGCNANSDCCGYPSDAICVDFGSHGTYCAPRCSYDSDCSENCCLATKQGNDVCHPASSCN